MILVGQRQPVSLRPLGAIHLLESISVLLILVKVGAILRIILEDMVFSFLDLLLLVVLQLALVGLLLLMLPIPVVTPSIL